MSKLWRTFEESARECPNKVFLYFYDEQYTYKQVELKAIEFAGYLTSLGIKSRDVVALMLPNSPEYIISMLACWKIGASVTPINVMYKYKEIEYQLGNSRAKAIVVDDSYHHEVLKIEGQTREKVNIVAMSSELSYRLTNKSTHDVDIKYENPENDMSDIALIIYTSGTTGYPKGVVLSHDNVLTNAWQISNMLFIDAKHTALLVLPLFHVNGIIITFVIPFVNRANIILRRKFVLDEFLPTVERYKPTYFSAVPTIYSRLAEIDNISEFDLSSLQFGICGAAPLPVEVFERFERVWGVKIVEGYGLSEGSCVSTFNPLNGPRKIGSVGVPLPGQEVRAVSDSGIALAEGGIGEIQVKGDNVMMGYLGNPSATSEALKDGWLATGDLGYRDTEGYFYIVDRKKEMIIRGGENIYPKEIENALHTNAKVFEAAVIGVPDPDYGEEVMACIVVRAGQEATEQEIRDFCKERLARYKTPKYIQFIDDLPKNAVGKISKKDLKKLILKELGV